MVKFEKVIQGLEHCHADNCSEGSKCPYYGEEYCLNTLMYDALELLKGQLRSHKQSINDDWSGAQGNDKERIDAQIERSEWGIFG